MSSAPHVPWSYALRNGNVAETMDVCYDMLREKGIPPVPTPSDGSLWCNATYDTVLCWPPTPANTSITLACPPLKGLDPSRYIEKRCDETGRWMGKKHGFYENPWGWTNYTICFKIDFEDVKIAPSVVFRTNSFSVFFCLFCGGLANLALRLPNVLFSALSHVPSKCDSSVLSMRLTGNITKTCHASGKWLGRSEDDHGGHGWTNYTMCFNDEVIYIVRYLSNESIGIAQEVARNARKLEFVGLGLSLVSLIVSIAIFSYFRRLRVFRNMLHLHLMVAILMVVIIRLVLYIDLIFTGAHGPHASPSEGKTINTMPFVCETMFFLLEYFKTVAFGWMFLEGFYLHNQLVLTVFNSEPRLTPYLLAGYGIPGIHTLFWLLVVLLKKEFKVERCLGSYYLEPEFWILDGPRMAELVVNLFFICNVIRVLWTKVRESHNTSELMRMKKSVKAALMLIPLLGIPNIMQTIPFNPTRDNIMIFAVWTYCASFTYMYQGLMITIIYCFTNKEVNTVLKAFYARYRLLHTSQNELRRGSRSVASHFQAKNGQVSNAMTNLDNMETGGNAGNNANGGKLSPFSSRSKKGSGDSTTKLMLPVSANDEVSNNNGYGSAGELTPLKCSCDATKEESPPTITR
ncbi:unnamed protein product [Caenorhabditis auriculariae]|uniref:Uncharacterized protein n=1 Tax=Caenorhabditis auriculariae TaxID=2777116 RepID=A0A8S1GYM7_9PELO|nr:unnamed protein product [Caenorhabditis auriculariae]